MKTQQITQGFVKTLILMVTALSFVAEARSSNLILSLSDSSYNIDPESLTNNNLGSVSPTSTASGIVWNGAFSDADTFYGAFTGSTKDLSSYTSVNLIMKLNSGINPGSTFTIGLANSNGDAAYFSGSTAGLTGLSQVALALAFSGGSFGLSDLTDVAGFQFTWDAGGDIDGTIVAVEAIPEPSSVSLLMLGAAGLVALRRLRKV